MASEGVHSVSIRGISGHTTRHYAQQVHPTAHTRINHLARGSIMCTINRCSVEPRVVGSNPIAHPNLDANRFGLSSVQISRVSLRSG